MVQPGNTDKWPTSLDFYTEVRGLTKFILKQGSDSSLCFRKNEIKLSKIYFISGQMFQIVAPSLSFLFKRSFSYLLILKDKTYA